MAAERGASLHSELLRLGLLLLDKQAALSKFAARTASKSRAIETASLG